MNADDVKKIHAGEVAAGKSPREAYHGTRSAVQCALHSDDPSPYPMPPPTALWIAGRQPTELEKALGVPLHIGIDLTPEQEAEFYTAERTELDARKSQLASSVSAEHARAHAVHAATNPHPSNFRRDGIHLAQQLHQSRLWDQADALVKGAIGDAP